MDVEESTKTMLTTDHLPSYQKKVLQDQYESSPFYLNNKIDLKPTQLDIFDFDSTLFLSPSLSPTIWHPSLIRQLVGEDVFGPGKNQGYFVLNDRWGSSICVFHFDRLVEGLPIVRLGSHGQAGENTLGALLE